MCSWCKKKTVGKPMVSGDWLRLICEHCGTGIDVDEKRIDYTNFREWIKEYYETYIKE
jgi:hypothetical protein